MGAEDGEGSARAHTTERDLGQNTLTDRVREEIPQSGAIQDNKNCKLPQSITLQTHNGRRRGCGGALEEKYTACVHARVVLSLRINKIENIHYSSFVDT